MLAFRSTTAAAMPEDDNAGATRRPGTVMAKSATTRQHYESFQENSGSDAFFCSRFVATSSESFFSRSHLARSLSRTFLPVADGLKPIPGISPPHRGQSIAASE
jgi:hypothetical protein